MAGICFGLVGDGESVPPAEPSSSVRRILEPPALKSFAEVGAKLPALLEHGRKRQRVAESFRLETDDDDDEGCGGRVSCRRRVEAGVGVKDGGDVFGGTGLEESKGASRVKAEDWGFPKFGLTSVCGRRRDMEDAVLVKPHMCGQSKGFHFYGVFDGHGCSHVAMKCKSRMHQIVEEEVQRYEDRPVEWKEAMTRSFRLMDKEAEDCSGDGRVGSNCRCKLQTPRCDAVGSTAVVAVVTPDEIVVSNCGDSRAVLCRSNGVAAIPLSSDHKPDRPDELGRIERAGGRVIYWEGARVLGVLAMSRAIGDNYLKPFVISDPEVTVTARTDEDECLILASDGLWDVVSNETACRVAAMCLRAHRLLEGSAAAGESSDRACADASMLLTKLALARHSSDNVSVVVVDLRKGKRNPRPTIN
ncbi:hypothetical protein MLD38_002640 [Melastoma candidum]|uniref:Uncharacterized protein n=1 Tax=Melastoma candidum TaxID=119954 RepID=A0ACB9RZZ9_9MYRT|nr:hypothetical protein MLD38_002640 [Melastoma candidum]